MDMSGYERFEQAVALGLRITLRHSVAIDADLRSSSVGKLRVKLTDISEHGCQRERSTSLVDGSFISLIMSDYALWRNRYVGWDVVNWLRFAAPLHPSILAHIVAMPDHDGSGQ